MQKDISRNFLTIQGWMSSRLKLKGNDLLLFALIYGFSQDGESYFTGSVSYMCNWLNCSKPTVNKSLFNLIELGVIIKKSETIQGVTFNSYKVSLQGVKKLYRGGKETLQGGGKETLQGGGKETLPNNILLDKDTLDNTDNTKEKSEIEISHPSFFDSEKEISEEELLKKQEEEIRKKVPQKKEEVVFPFQTEKFLEYWQVWKQYKDKEHKFKYKTIESEQAALKKLSELSGFDENKAIRIIENSMANGWKGFFELKKESNARESKSNQQIFNEAMDSEIARNFRFK